MVSVGPRGRTLEVLGWHDFEPDQQVGSLRLHVESRRALLITSYTLADTLITAERPEALAALVLCAQDIAAKLHSTLNVGNGCLEWRVDSDKIGNIHRLFPTFSMTGKLHRFKRGKRYLRRCP